MALIDPEDYPTTPRGYRHPPDDVGGVNVANDVPGDVTRLAEDVDADVATVAAAADGADAGDLAAHVAATQDVHGIANTASLVTKDREILPGTGLTGGGDLSEDRTLDVVFGASAGTVAEGDDARLSDARVPTPHAASHKRGGADDIGAVDRASIGNLLADNVATGTDTLGTTQGFTALVGAPLLESSTEQASRGTRSLKMTTTTTGNEGVIAAPVPVSGGELYTFLLDLFSDADEFVQLQVRQYRAGGELTGSPWINFQLTPAWQSAAFTVKLKDDAATVRVAVQRFEGAAGAAIYCDSLSLHRGAGGLWVPPGVPVPNLGIRANPANPAQVQVWNPGNTTWITV